MPGAAAISKSRRRTGSRRPDYHRYICLVRDAAAPKRGLTTEAKDTLNALVQDYTDRLADRCSELCHEGRITVGVRELAAAVRMELPAGLVQGALKDAYEALETFRASTA